VWDGETLLFVLEDGGNNHLYRVRTDGIGAPAAEVDGESWVTGYDVAAGTIAHTVSSPTSPGELYCAERRLTDVTGAFTGGCALSEPERFTAVSADGSEVEAWLMRPVGFEPGRRYPVLLNIHGGPFSQYGNKFFDEFQVLADRGTARNGGGRSAALSRAVPGGVRSTTRM
jgi:dipeptidyl aminopeptidase/acylaminoacyl peptidase